MNARTQSPGSPFTLPEMLATVSMVLLLASLLLPVLGRAQRQSEAVYCGGNLRQLGAAMMMYCQDNAWRLPPYMPSQYGHGGRNWGTYLRPYYEEVKVLDCPSSPDGPPEDSPRGLYLQDGNYGWNYDGTQGNRGSLHTHVSEPSRGYLLFDSGDPCVIYGANTWDNLMEELDLDWDSRGEGANRHGGQVQVYHVDGHAERLPLMRFLAAPCKTNQPPWYLEWEGGELRQGVVPYPKR